MNITLLYTFLKKYHNKNFKNLQTNYNNRWTQATSQNWYYQVTVSVISNWKFTIIFLQRKDKINHGKTLDLNEFDIRDQELASKKNIAINLSHVNGDSINFIKDFWGNNTLFIGNWEEHMLTVFVW